MDTVGLLHGLSIFIVEDNLENRMVMRLLLNHHGARVEFDNWGRNTVSRLEAFAPVDLILMDLMLGGVHGANIFDEIHSVPKFSQVPIVAVSASDPVQAIPMCRRKGFSGFIAKPVDDDLLPQQLIRILNHENVWYVG